MVATVVLLEDEASIVKLELLRRYEVRSVVQSLVLMATLAVGVVEVVQPRMVIHLL